MEESTPNPPIMPQSQEPPVYGPVASPPAPQKPSAFDMAKFRPIIIVAVIILVLVVGSLVYISHQQPKVAAVPTPTPTLTPTPTPVLILTSYATQSAFMDFEKNVTSLPDTVQNAVLLDPRLSPPDLDLTLGF